MFIILTVVEIFILLTLFVHIRWTLTHSTTNELPKKKELVKQLELTDLAIWTEARYTRHPSQADYFSAFQDSPSSLEHFPAGSVVAPPEALWTTGDAVAGRGD